METKTETTEPTIGPFPVESFTMTVTIPAYVVLGFKEKNIPKVTLPTTDPTTGKRIAVATIDRAILKGLSEIGRDSYADVTGAAAKTKALIEYWGLMMNGEMGRTPQSRDMRILTAALGIIRKSWLKVAGSDAWKAVAEAAVKDADPVLYAVTALVAARGDDEATIPDRVTAARTGGTEIVDTQDREI